MVIYWKKDNLLRNSVFFFEVFQPLMCLQSIGCSFSFYIWSSAFYYYVLFINHVTFFLLLWSHAFFFFSSLYNFKGTRGCWFFPCSCYIIHPSYNNNISDHRWHFDLCACVGKINTFLLMKPLLITSFDVTEKYGRNGEISETYRKI